MLRSFRTRASSELIQEGCQQGLISVELERPTASKISLGLEGNKKSLRVDEKVCGSKSKFPFLGGSLSFSPDDLMLVKGSPEARRTFLDDFSISLDPHYSAILQRYEKVLKQRNALLKSIKEGRAHFEELPLWTESLIEAAMPIYKERLRAIELLNRHMPVIYQQLFNTKEVIRLRYHHRFQDELSDDAQVIESQMIDKLNQLLPAEQASGFSLVGPHKDDVDLMINDLDCRTYGSQGQTRGLVIALKITQLELNRSFRNWSPILLLDDIISEFDDSRVQALVDYLSKYPGQLFVTTAEVSKVKTLHGQFSGFKVIDLGLNSSRKSQNQIDFVLEAQG